MSRSGVVSGRPATLDVEQAESALLRHYPRLVRLAYGLLGAGPGRARVAHEVTRAALPRRCTSTARLPLTGMRDEDPAYVWLRLRVVRAALERRWWPRRPGSPARADAPARAAYALRHLEGLADPDIRHLLGAARVRDPEAALAAAETVTRAEGAGPVLGRQAEPRTQPAARTPQQTAPPSGAGDGSPPAPACAVCEAAPHARTVVRRRRRRRAAAAALGAALACCGLLGMPGDTWGPDAATHAPLLRGTDTERALDPDTLIRVDPDAWRHASRPDLEAWPARGSLTGDESLLRRALVTWARPRTDVRVTTTPGTPDGPPPGPPHLLYADRLDGTAVVVLYDGLRVARYTEPLHPGDGSRAARNGVSLELARAAGGKPGAFGALAVARGENQVRYLTAPWIAEAAEVDLRDPGDREGRPLSRDAAGVTEPVTLPVTQPRHCRDWPGLALAGRGGVAEEVRLYADLGEPTVAQLTDGRRQEPATDTAARRRLARTVCRLPAVLDTGVQSVNSWEFARQQLPEGGGEAAWVCTRAETWRGTGARVTVLFRRPPGAPGRGSTVASRTRDSPACGPRAPQVLAGLRWRSPQGHWFVLAAADADVTRLRARGADLAYGPTDQAGRTLTARVPGREHSARLSGRRPDGSLLHVDGPLTRVDSKQDAPPDGRPRTAGPP